MGVVHQSDDVSTPGITDVMLRGLQTLSFDAMVAMMYYLSWLLWLIVTMPCCDGLVMWILDQ
jgi:hypothetical protein